MLFKTISVRVKKCHHERCKKRRKEESDGHHKNMQKEDMKK